MLSSQVEYDTIIPNNVSLSSDRRVLKALEKWHPGYIDWWKDLGPVGFQDMLVYLRTAINVDKDGWATFDYVKMPEYRWGILLAPQKEGRTMDDITFTNGEVEVNFDEWLENYYKKY